MLSANQDRQGHVLNEVVLLQNVILHRVLAPANLLGCLQSVPTTAV